MVTTPEPRDEAPRWRWERVPDAPKPGHFLRTPDGFAVLFLIDADTTISRRAQIVDTLNAGEHWRGPECQCDPPGSGEEWCKGDCQVRALQERVTALMPLAKRGAYWQGNCVQCGECKPSHEPECWVGRALAGTGEGATG